jgi:hypothetical protein
MKIYFLFPSKLFSNFVEIPIIHEILMVMSQRPKVNNVFQITTNPLKIPQIDSENYFDVPIPMSHIGLKNIQCRILSKIHRNGMVKLLNFLNY